MAYADGMNEPVCQRMDVTDECVCEFVVNKHCDVANDTSYIVGYKGVCYKFVNTRNDKTVPDNHKVLGGIVDVVNGKAFELPLRRLTDYSFKLQCCMRQYSFINELI
jgi:hypothetical protein